MSFTAREIKSINLITSLLRKIRLYNDALRAKEIFLIGGVSFLGLIFNPHKISIDILPDWIFIMLSSWALLGHSFASNDWSGYYYDRYDENKKNRPLIKGEISLTEIKILSLSLLLISMFTALLVSDISLYIVCAIIVLNYLYSGRMVFLKSVPVMSTVIHGSGASLGFLLGYSYTGYVDLTGICFACYFGIIYAAGHFNHEIMDNNSDKKSGISTTAALVGTKKLFIASYILFSSSFFYIIFLVLLSILPVSLITGVIISFLAYTYFFIVTFKSDLDYMSMIWFRQKYRIIFLLWGIFLALNILLNKS